MRTRAWLTAASFGAILFAASPAILAQWAPYPTANVPKTRSGEPDLGGPVPRTAEGKPDLSGLWDRVGSGGGASGQSPESLQSPDGGPPAATFWNVGAGFDQGLPFQPLAAQLRAERMSNNQKNNPDALCLPMGLMQLHLHPQPRKIVQTPDVIVILYEGNSGLRQIFTDGRPLPTLDEDLQPWWYGYSAGRWEGDTLVVETIGFRDDVWLDVQGSPLTNRGKMTERFRRSSYGTLQIDVTIEDPSAYTKPFTVRVNQRVMLDTELIEFICNENEKSVQHFDP
jgi:hypothetical protein